MNLRTLLVFVLGLIVGGAALWLYPWQDSSQGASGGGAVLALSGNSYTVEQLPPAAARAIFEVDQEAWQRKSQILSGAAGEMFIQKKVKESGKSREDVMTEVFELATPTDEQVQAFYDENKARIPAPFEQIKEQIRNYLTAQELQQKRENLTSRLKSDEGLKVLLAEPEAPLTVIDTKGFPSKGNEQAKVTIVEFADYQCPHCSHATNSVNELMEEIGDKVRLVYMDFPINSSGISRDVALGAVCADEQGKYWDYNKAAFADQSALNDDSKMSLAEQVGLDMDVFNSCLASDRPETKVVHAEQEAERLGLTGTPSFFVNGKSIQPADLGEGLKTAIKQAAGIN